jgi:hypothetical protein
VATASGRVEKADVLAHVESRKVPAATAALGARFGIGKVPTWQAATAISAARLLAPGWPVPDGRS